MKIKDLKQDHPLIYARALKHQKDQVGIIDDEKSLYDAFLWRDTTEKADLWIEVNKGNVNSFYDFYADQPKPLTGVELIAKERAEQIEKHGKTVEKDCLHNKNKELITVARELLTTHPGNMGFPENWNRSQVHKIASKPYKERLIVAGALIAAEIDRLNAHTQS